nr:2-hydroxy-3-oxopropionate reductase [uncultured bacterium]
MTVSTVALLGVGLMGAPVAERLLAAGFALALWNRTAAKLTPFAGRATLASTPEEAVTQADVIITLLENGAVVDAVLYQSAAIEKVQAGALVIDMSSITPAQARAHAARCQSLGLRYVDAPVSGGTRGAAAGTLAIMAGGKAADIDAAAAVFAALGKATRIGEVGCGQLAKLANQAIVGITIGAVAEALLLAAAGGADPAAVREALLGGFAGSKILEQHGERMLTRNFTPGAPARIQLKDMHMICNQARELGLTLPLAEDTLAAYDALVAQGHGEVDHAGLLLGLEAANQKRLDGRC